MARRKTTKEFIDQARKIHGDKYDYSEVTYIRSTEKVKIVCLEHGKFEQKAWLHLQGYGCKLCAIELTRRKHSLGLSEFIKRAQEKHGNIYDYSLVEYKNTGTKIKIVCPKHGSFYQRAGNHLSGDGCPECGKEKISKKKRSTYDDFLKKSKSIHGNLYDYSCSEYTLSSEKIKIICYTHGSFWMTPDNHLQGQGCPECGKEKVSQKFSDSCEDFIKKAKEVHGDKYNYDLVEYRNRVTPIKIVCPKHGIFHQRPADHLYQKSGCPSCKSSIGENWIENLLKKNEIKFIKEYSFNIFDGQYKTLKLDFFLPELNTAIEFDGIQHSKPINHFGGKEAFLKRQLYDLYKDQWCMDNCIKLIRINHEYKIKILT